MTRSITAGMNTEIAAESGVACNFIELQFSGGTIRFTTAPHNMSWNSLTWTGIGGALAFEPVQETQDLSANGVNMVLSGVDQAVISILLQQFYIGRVVKIWLVHLTAAGTIVADPLLIFNGKMNGGFEIEESRSEDSPGTVTITGRMSDRLSDLEARNGIQTNMDSHQRIFSGDLFFQFVPDLATKDLTWGQPWDGT